MRGTLPVGLSAGKPEYLLTPYRYTGTVAT